MEKNLRQSDVIKRSGKSFLQLRIFQETPRNRWLV